MLLTTLLALSLAAPARADKKPPEKPLKAFATLAKEPKLDGVLKDMAQATSLKGPKGLDAKVGFRKDTVYVAAKVDDADVTADDVLDLMIYFPGAGTTARGYVYRLALDGVRAADADVSAPEWARALVKSVAARDAKGVTFEAAIPVRALPRFPGQGQLGLHACLTWNDAKFGKTSNCAGTDMPGGPMKLPDEARKVLKATVPADVEGVEPRPDGFVGYAVLHYPLWAVGDSELTSESIARLVVGDAAVDAVGAGLGIPPELRLPDNRLVLSVVTGKNPYRGNDCQPDAELRLALYVASGRAATRVLEWPAATCMLGRATKLDLNAEGQLSIVYSNGTQAHFQWTKDRFERSELGQR